MESADPPRIREGTPSLESSSQAGCVCRERVASRKKQFLAVEDMRIGTTPVVDASGSSRTDVNGYGPSEQTGKGLAKSS